MATDKVKTAFRLSSWVNNDVIRNLIWQHRKQQQHQGIINNNNQQQQNIKQFTSENVWKYTQEKTCAEVFFSIKFQVLSLQLYQKRDSDTGVFL